MVVFLQFFSAQFARANEAYLWGNYPADEKTVFCGLYEINGDKLTLKKPSFKVSVFSNCTKDILWEDTAKGCKPVSIVNHVPLEKVNLRVLGIKPRCRSSLNLTSDQCQMVKARSADSLTFESKSGSVQGVLQFCEGLESSSNQAEKSEENNAANKTESSSEGIKKWLEKASEIKNTPLEKLKNVKKIGKGHTKVIYEAELEHGLKVAYYNISTKLASSKRAEVEAQSKQYDLYIHQKLSNPETGEYIPGILHSYGTKIQPQTGTIYHFIEHMKDGSLFDYSKKHPISVAQAYDIASQACNAIVGMHSKKIVHTDLKPENLLVSEQPNHRLSVRVGDFDTAYPFADGPKDKPLVYFQNGTTERYNPPFAGKILDQKTWEDTYKMNVKKDHFTYGMTLLFSLDPREKIWHRKKSGGMWNHSLGQEDVNEQIKETIEYLGAKATTQPEKEFLKQLDSILKCTMDVTAESDCKFEEQCKGLTRL